MAETLTPMMRQYQAMRRELPPGTLLLFRLGDFYELFFDDAKEASSILNLALTKRMDVPMCGVPYHSARNYIEKLIAAGKRVAICEQVGEVEPGKLVRRELTHILSAGSLDDFGLEDRKPNYLAAIQQFSRRWGLAYADVSTGELRVTETDQLASLEDALQRIQPAELLLPPEAERELTHAKITYPLTTLDGWHFDPESAQHNLCRLFGVQNLDGFGCRDLPAAVGCAGALLHYLQNVLRRNVSHFRKITPEFASQTLLLDATTCEHLELIDSRSGRACTLLGTLDRTLTPMGARTLRYWLLHPLLDPQQIHARQDALSAFLSAPLLLSKLRDALAQIRDIERALSRLNLGTGNPRDLASLCTSLETLPSLLQILHQIPTAPSAAPPLLSLLANQIHPLPELTARLRSALAEPAPVSIRDGGIIRSGFDPRLDELRNAAANGKQWIAELQEREIQRTGIKSLKVRYNSIFGYFIEVTRANLHAVPPDYIRKQTTANGERFITPELKDMEDKILGAEERARALETELFHELRLQTLAHLLPIQETASAIGQIDALASLAETARLYSYCRPTVDNSKTIRIRNGRHPVLDARPTPQRFVPNDTDLDGQHHRIAIITGPNMAGKSTYIRQVALLVLLAQIGSFLPADSAHIGIADRIFTRVGASDDLASGRSTFLVEMSETANILNCATDRSLVILDEIGRGTSTFDGLSIAWSVAEYLHDHIRCRTLFATHYHELTDLERTCPGVINLNVAVREWNDQIIFLHKILPGRADQSYGIHVAKLAGLPDDVIQRAREILRNLERSELNADGKPALAQGARRRAAAILGQLELNLTPPQPPPP